MLPSITPVSAQVGEENTQQIVANQSNQKVEAETVIQQEITDVPPWVLILLILGWLAPSPQEMGRGTTSFILQLFGRKA